MLLAVKVVPVPLLTTVELPRVPPPLYVVPFTGDTEGDVDVDIKTVYPVTPLAAVKLPCMLLEVTFEKISDVPCAEGEAQAGSAVAWFPDNGELVR